MESTFLPSDANDLLAGSPFPWFLAGGWAIDAFLGFQSRLHADLDIAVLRSHQQQLRQHLDGWDLHVAVSSGVLEKWEGNEIPSALHVIWCRRSPGVPWAFEVLLNDHDETNWLFRRNHDVRMDLNSISRVSQDGLPYLVPEIVLLYKAKERRDTDARDLDRCLPLLDAPARNWLRAAIVTTHGDSHPWLSQV